MMTGKELERLREAKGISRADLAKQLGTTSVSIWRWENEKYEINTITERAIRGVLEEN